jgi:hypothetical protein
MMEVCDLAYWKIFAKKVWGEKSPVLMFDLFTFKINFIFCFEFYDIFVLKVT